MNRLKPNRKKQTTRVRLTFCAALVKFRYNARCHWLKERALSENKTRSLAICQFLLCTTVSRTSLWILFVNFKVKFRNKRAGK